MLRQDSDHLKSHISLTIKMEIDFHFIFTVKEREKDTVTISDCITGTSLAPIELTRICLEILFSFDDVLYMKEKAL